MGVSVGGHTASDECHPGLDSHDSVLVKRFGFAPLRERIAMIQVTNLSKYYGGKHALGPVSFEIEDGEAIGFLGLNGAGKTTALRILACDLRPSAGSISVGGVDAISDPHEVRKRIGFRSEERRVGKECNFRL